MANVILDKVSKSYDGVATVHGIDLAIAEGEFVVLVGPSGCGKSTTLRMIAGLESITAGEIRIDERRINEYEPGDRDIAMVFQNYALYPHLTVADNITFGLRLRKTPRAEVQRRLEETAEILEISHLLRRKPRQLSGGQRQRVAMGRALIRRPAVFLFDEPLSNLDAKLRVQMRAEIKQLHARIPTTTIYVTHDQVEAMTLADRIVVMNQGRIEQIATPQDLYEWPATRFVADFIGAPGTNFVPAMVRRDGDRLSASIEGGWILWLPAERAPAYAAFVDRPVLAGVRPEHFALAPPAEASGDDRIEVTLGVVEPLGMETLAHFSLANQPMIARLSPDRQLAQGKRISLRVQPGKIHLIDPQTEKVIY
jgi:multiple sugar transport system ATP-binding protein